MPAADEGRARTRTRIVDVAARLLREGGPAAVTTRAVADAAGVQAPAIYRIFGDKDGLLEAVAEHVMTVFVSAKAATAESSTAGGQDPLDDLRTGWDTQIGFGVDHPTLFRLLSDPDRVRRSPAVQLGRQVLQARVHRVAESGRLRVSEARAVDVLQAAGTGTIHTLLSTPPDQRDAGLADSVYDAVLRQILVESAPPPDDEVLTAAVALRSVVDRLDELTTAEQQLLAQWLDRAIGRRQ